MAKNISPTQIRKDIQSNIASEIYKRKKMQNMVRIDSFDSEIRDYGIQWGIHENDINDADENIRNNTNFIRGYEKGKRLVPIYKEGKNFFLNGGSIEQATEKMRNNEYFVQGYNEAMNDFMKSNRHTK